jgi:hypothetical protein
MNDLPVQIPPGYRYGRAVQLARGGGGGGRAPAPRPVEVAQLPEPPRAAPPAPAAAMALVTPPPPPPAAHRSFYLIQPAVAEPIPFRRGAETGDWAIQVGAYASESQAHAALGMARRQAHVELAAAHTFVGSVHQGHTVLWRARLIGLSREAAVQACGRLAHSRTSCMVLSPDAQG